MFSTINNLAIAKKLYGFAAVLLALMALVGVLGIKNLNKVADSASAAYDNSTAPLADLGQARAKANENRALLNNHILETDPATGEGAREARSPRTTTLIDTELAAVAKTLKTDAGKKSFTGADRLAEGVRAARAKVLELSRAEPERAGVRAQQVRCRPRLRRRRQGLPDALRREGLPRGQGRQRQRRDQGVQPQLRHRTALDRVRDRRRHRVLARSPDLGRRQRDAEGR